MKHAYSIGLGLALLAPGVRAQSIPPTEATKVLAPLVGRDYTAAPGLGSIGFYGTDLGYTAVHDGQLRILFGDTWADPTPHAISPWAVPPRDDSQGTICLQAFGCPLGANVFPTGDAVEAYINSHPAGGLGQPWRGRQGPPVWWRLDAFGQVASMPVYRNGVLLNMGALRTPLAAFSNTQAPLLSDAFFALFGRPVAALCPGPIPLCPSTYTCDSQLGTVNGDTTEDAVPCINGGTANCVAQPLGGGVCVDTTNGIYNTGNSATANDFARLLSVVLRLEIGNADPLIQEQYYTQSWYSSKFVSPAMRAVNDFIPGRVLGNDYNPPDGFTTGREKVLIWGRPWFGGSSIGGLNIKTFFAYADMPSFSATGNFAWVVHYFTGTVAGIPVFSLDPRQAKALDLSGLDDGLPTADTEKWDVINQMSVSFVPSLGAVGKWVMLYGGGAAPGISTPDPEGAIHIRFASNPWGPWTKPAQLLKGSDSYGPGGIMFSQACGGAPGCTPADGTRTDDGFLYGANVIDPWTKDRGSFVDLYWNVSTWDPYQVVLVKSRINK